MIEGHRPEMKSNLHHIGEEHRAQHEISRAQALVERAKELCKKHNEYRPWLQMNINDVEYALQGIKTARRSLDVHIKGGKELPLTAIAAEKGMIGDLTLLLDKLSRSLQAIAKPTSQR